MDVPSSGLDGADDAGINKSPLLPLYAADFDRLKTTAACKENCRSRDALKSRWKTLNRRAATKRRPAPLHSRAWEIIREICRRGGPRAYDGTVKNGERSLSGDDGSDIEGDRDDIS